MSSTIVAVIVTYQPSIQELEKLFERLKLQVSAIIVVDNGSESSAVNWLGSYSFFDIKCVFLEKNYGIATAQNVGISWAREYGADFVVLFDQDSEPAPDMLVKLMEAYEIIFRQQSVAALGPRYIDSRQNNPPPFIRVNGWHLERCICPTDEAVVNVDYLISSGCLIPMETLDIVGNMAEELFIDYVDIEWGLRAKFLGFQSFGVCSAHMKHSLGENPISFLGRKIPLHSPLRHYYHFRNAVWLYRQSNIPMNWKMVDGWRLFLKYGFYTLFAKPRFKQFTMMSLGVLHGVFGRMGAYGSSVR